MKRRVRAFPSPGRANAFRIKHRELISFDDIRDRIG